MVVAAILAYHSAAVIVFGTLFLMTFPERTLRIGGVKGPLDSDRLTLYRICGLWVAAGGVVSAAAWWGGTAEQQWWVCTLYALVHTLETLLKISTGSRAVSVAANGHLAILLMLASGSW